MLYPSRHGVMHSTLPKRGVHAYSRARTRSWVLRPAAAWLTLAMVGCAPLGRACSCASLRGADPPSVPVLASRMSGLPGIPPADEELMERLLTAFTEKGPNYRPRTRHLQADGRPKYINRLILETSPYLLQHAHNPVNWFAFGEDAFARARSEDKPVLLSVGYSTCHWCHVMERESFEDEEIARALNQHYIAIKVDREQRPDVDDTFMKAVQLLTGRGGWPMTVVMTPDKQPFFAGTYFPPRDGDRGARIGFLTILEELRRGYDEERDAIVARAQDLSQRIAALSIPDAPGDIPDASSIEQVVQHAKRTFDPTWGGFGAAPKFPRPVLLDLLLRYHRRTGDDTVLHLVTHTLQRMAAGGMYDHAGGGFHRYATDRQWLVPHFEKMLYDNAQLVPIYVYAYQLTKRPGFARVARETLDYVGREMTAPGGGFYSATDADSLTPAGEEQEGYYFTWTMAELSEALSPEELRVARAYFGATEAGNFEGRNVLHVARAPQAAARDLDLSEPALSDQLNAIRRKLYQARQRRPAPLRDDKILASWNGLMISAFARAALLLNEPEYLRRAEAAGDFILTQLRDPEGNLQRCFQDGQASHPAYLDDHAFMIQALLDVFEATGDPRWLPPALALQETLDTHFSDRSRGGYYMTSDRHDPLIARDKPLYDGAEPSGNSVALLNLLRLAEITEDARYRQRAERGLAAFHKTLTTAPAGSPHLLAALERYLDRPIEVFVIQPDGAAAAAAPLLARFRSTYLPNRAFVHSSEGASLSALARLMPGLSGKRALEGKATAFVCEGGRCELPTSDPDAFEGQLAAVRTPLPVAAAPAVPR